MPSTASMDRSLATDIENTPTDSSPLLQSDSDQIARLRSSRDWIACHIATIHGEDHWVWRLRQRLQLFLSSKWGHYFVIILVTLDITCIFADFLLSLHICEHGGETGFPLKSWQRAVEVTSIMGLIFSSLFMAELLGSLFAFGFSYFKSAFHTFDACVIIASFMVDVLLRGPLEEAGSLIIILRLWRIVKIVEEFSAGASEQTDGLYARISELQDQTKELQKANEGLKRRIDRATNGSGRLGQG